MLNGRTQCCAFDLWPERGKMKILNILFPQAGIEPTSYHVYSGTFHNNNIYSYKTLASS